jgi:hypothetical protein
MVITAAFEQYQELEIAIAKQGGWQEYEHTLLNELKQIPDEFKRKGGYRQGEIYLASAASPGIQLADFYVGSIRQHHRNSRAVHEKIKRVRPVSFDLLRFAV